MFENLQTPGDRMIVAAVFGLVLMLWFAGVLVWMIRRDAKVRRLRRRIGILDEAAETPSRVLTLWREGKEDASTLVPYHGVLGRMVERFERVPRDAGWDISPTLLIACLCLLVGGVMGVSVVLTGSALAAAGLGIMAGVAFAYYVQHRIEGRRTAFEQQFEDAMNLIARSLRAGQPLLGSFQLVAEEMDPPISAAFHEICQQQALGMSLEDAIRRVAASYDNKDLNLFATSVVIQLRTGGNLADMMQRLAQVIRERLKLVRRVRVLTAQTQYSKRVLLILPLVMFVLLTVMDPRYMDPMYTTRVGQYLSAAAVLSMVLGTWVMNRMVRVRF